jgi:hypothetical protein
MITGHITVPRFWREVHIPNALPRALASTIYGSDPQITTE